MIAQAIALVLLIFTVSQLRAVAPDPAVVSETSQPALTPSEPAQVTPPEAPSQEKANETKTAPATTPPATPPATTELSIEHLLAQTLKQNGMIAEASQDVEIARSQIALARAALFPKASATVLLAPMFEIRGNPEHADYNTNKWGPFVQGGIQIVEPLYTFGMIPSYRKAAEEQLNAKTGLANAKKNEVTLMAKEFYYGFLMAKDLEGLVADLISFLEEAVKTSEERPSSPTAKSSVKPHDRYKLKMALADLKQKRLLAESARKTAAKALNWVAGTEYESFDSLPSGVQSFEKKKLEDYLLLAKQNRPEFKALTAGIRARTALKEAKEAQKYPVVFAGGFLSKSYSPMANRQQSAFANDPFNGFSGGLGVGLRFDLEFARQSAEVQEQEAEMMKLKATESYAIPGIELQVKKAYWELEQATQGLEIAQERKKMGKKWFVSNAMGFSVGITPAKDLMESLEGDGNARKNYIETVYSLNMALAKLTQAVGSEVTHLKYQ